MSWFQALILGIIQGLTEFLPISSSGHLMLVENIFGLDGSNLFFNLLVHFATLIAVVIVFWNDIIGLIKKPFGNDMFCIVIATIPTVILAFVVKFFINEFALVEFLGFGFLISSVVIFITFLLQKKSKKVLSYDIDKRKAFYVGVAQGIAVLPGISRSGSTICACLLQGVEREKSAKFSFLISIPVIIGGVVFEIIEGVMFGFGDINFTPCLIGFISAFVVALFTINLMMKIVKNGKWWFFSLYLFVLSIVVLLNQYFFCWF